MKGERVRCRLQCFVAHLPDLRVDGTGEVPPRARTRVGTGGGGGVADFRSPQKVLWCPMQFYTYSNF